MSSLSSMKTKLSRFYYWFVSWPFDTTTAFMMVLLGLSMMLWPDRGISGYMQTTFHFPMQYFGVMTTLSALEMMYHPGVTRFAIFSTPVMIYAGMSVPYAINGFITQQLAAGPSAAISWCFLYWLMNYVNARRANILIKNAYVIMQ